MQSQCRSHGLVEGSQVYIKGQGFVEAASSLDHFLSSLFTFFLLDHSQRHAGSDADHSGEEPSQYCSFACDVTSYGDIV